MNIRGRNKVTPEFNMSSMTDIVFLLLVFFMIASTLVSANAIDLLLPKSGGKTTEFHLSSFKGEIFSVQTEEEPDAPPPPKPRYSMYGEEVDEQPSMWNEK